MRLKICVIEISLFVLIDFLAAESFSSRCRLQKQISASWNSLYGRATRVDVKPLFVSHKVKLYNCHQGESARLVHVGDKRRKRNLKKLIQIRGEQRSRVCLFALGVEDFLCAVLPSTNCGNFVRLAGKRWRENARLPREPRSDWKTSLNWKTKSTQCKARLLKIKRTVKNQLRVSA